MIYMIEEWLPNTLVCLSCKSCKSCLFLFRAPKKAVDGSRSIIRMSRGRGDRDCVIR